MRLSTRAMAISGGLLWGGALLLLGLVNLGSPTYGAAFLGVVSSVYPGFHASRTFGDVIVGALYGTIDGAAAGFVFAWLYNLVNKQSASTN